MGMLCSGLGACCIKSSPLLLVPTGPMQPRTGHPMNLHLKVETLSPSAVEELLVQRTPHAQPGAAFGGAAAAAGGGSCGRRSGPGTGMCKARANSASKFGAKSRRVGPRPPGAS